MARTIPMDQPLNDEDRQYLMDRGREDVIGRLDYEFPADDADDDGEPDEAEEAPDYSAWTKQDLVAEVDNRNASYPDLNMSNAGTKADLQARLEEHDVALAQG